MKTTRYFKREWCRQALEEPAYYEMQEEDERIRYWIYIAELNCYLRVVTLNDGETIHNAFPDHSFQP